MFGRKNLKMFAAVKFLPIRTKQLRPITPETYKPLRSKVRGIMTTLVRVPNELMVDQLCKEEFSNKTIPKTIISGNCANSTAINLGISPLTELNNYQATKSLLEDVFDEDFLNMFRHIMKNKCQVSQQSEVCRIGAVLRW
ncbi:uncharacterized protein LOC132194341 isoform X2 [Neocloeon triangulifer]|uniref:uncharacterized protein LOC132194341 isoform X2 n=1 Tax=Neocloeon triangulifer TaxID=2078957 RepID=UPI00286F9674|nr:uncharacterized protein LOC132194341 isoform X2 [Neocloeon triangulifer]